MSTPIETIIVSDILVDLLDRKGIGDELKSIDEEVYSEIADELIVIVNKALERNAKEKEIQLGEAL